ncbi:23S rRNA (adenine(2030)-N(6))-methyltransferase RlmJ [Swingsia samuiensis]|uniref:Ribosomal RNA large subunit methyltransferase J n=1 Tax=Swingsia samuiensis TaxID=1293412 RepID=A0A4Y6UKH4_9PROT|nr:23S rRNA (adenine(2030)-N(6))-methyltransferase RlmJ [Swingsia samuiensis]QDH17574.1 23S rRNA (adenine(2030)-N(6))-methyltransferase RlmJ [Swingsia samuiensis]
MNYRHIYHAGNFADCVKHAIVLSILHSLKRKQTGFSVLDTHAGRGKYDLSSLEAEKTGEWESGIGLAQNSTAEALQDYLSTIHYLGLYPGSPALIRYLLRPQDQLIACELHPEDVKPLRRLFRSDPQVAVHHRDGYEALRALLPPKEFKRGFILIDPPFEKPDDFSKCVEAIAFTRTHFRAGIIAVWFPIKHRTPIRQFYQALKDAAIQDIISCEFLLRPALDPSRLNGCGMLLVNAPYGTQQNIMAIFEALKQALTTENTPDIQYSIERITEE